MLGAEWEFVVQRALVQQRVGHRDQEEVDGEARDEARDHAKHVDAHTDGLDLATRLEGLEGSEPATVLELAQERFHAVVAVVHRVEVVNEERVDHRDAHALDAVFIGPHHAVAGVVEADLDGQGSVGHRSGEGGRIGGPVQGASDLGGEGVGVAGLGAQDGSEAKLALAPAVPRRGVVEGDARGPGGLQGGGRLRFRDGPAHVADGCRATPEGRQGEGGVSELLQAVRIHGALSIAPAPGGMRGLGKLPGNPFPMDLLSH